MSELQINVTGKVIECNALKRHLVQGENYGEIIRFTLDRNVDGVDLYNNMSYNVTGLHLHEEPFVDNLRKEDATDPKKFHLIWEVSKYFTKRSGAMQIWINAIFRSGGTEHYRWSTIPHRIFVQEGFSFAKHIDLTDESIERFSEMLNQIYEHAKQAEESAKQACECAAQAKESEEQSAISAQISVANAEVAKESAESAKEDAEKAGISADRAKISEIASSKNAEKSEHDPEISRQHMVNAGTYARDAQNAVAGLPLKLEEFLLGFKGFINPITGDNDYIQNIFFALADRAKPNPISQQYYESGRVSVQEYDEFNLSRLEYDWYAKNYIHKN